MFQIIANGSYNLRAYSAATVFIHSLPIAKVLHITSLRIFLLNRLTIMNLSSCFSFFCPRPKRGSKKKNNGRTGSNLYYVGIIQTSVAKHSPKMYRYTFGKANYSLLAIAGITQKAIVYLTGMGIMTMPCPCSLD